MRKVLRKISVVHPFLFAIFPILYYYRENAHEIETAELALPLLVTFVLVAILFLLFRLITGSSSRGGIVVSFFTVLFFSYGVTKDFLVSVTSASVYSVSFFLGLLWALLCTVVAILMTRSRSEASRLTHFLNGMAFVLVFISLVSIGIYYVQTRDISPDVSVRENVQPKPYLPDIYYVVLDSYARSSTLEETYNYDNSDFNRFLTDHGFYVAEKSRSNYDRTYLSLTSSLNMRYLTPEEKTVEAKLVASLVDNEALRFLKSQGYRGFAVTSSFEFKGIDHYFERYSPRRAVLGMPVGNFVSALIQYTALWPFEALLTDRGAQAILDAFDALEQIPEEKGPKFVFAHIFSPHHPLIFDRDGNITRFNLLNFRSPVKGNETERFLEQTLFVTKKIKVAIEEILAKSEVKPIIILQSDHGPGTLFLQEVGVSGLTEKQLNDRMNILNAYLLPEKVEHLLYENVTPVNTFRIIFNLYFSAGFELLKDESYFSITENIPFDFILVPPERTD